MQVDGCESQSWWVFESSVGGAAVKLSSRRGKWDCESRPATSITQGEETSVPDPEAWIRMA